MSNRSVITDKLVEALRDINGSASPYSSTYHFKTDLHYNVYRGLKLIDEINDFPSMYITSPKETREYNTRGTTIAVVNSEIRCYVYGDDTEQLAQNLVDDVEHVIDNLTYSTTHQVLDSKINVILRDNGLFKPLGLIEIFLSTSFEMINY